MATDHDTGSSETNNYRIIENENPPKIVIDPLLEYDILVLEDNRMILKGVALFRGGYDKLYFKR